MMNLPLDAEPLGDGHFVWADASNTSFGIQFFIYTLENGYWQRTNSCDLRYPAEIYWRTPRPDELKCRLSPYGQSVTDPKVAAALGESISMAAVIMEALNEGADEKIREAEARLAQERIEREQREKERREQAAIAHRERHLQRLRLTSRQTHIFELVKWQLGEKIKLTRDNYRATVFGTIDHVEESYMNITTEKGKFMRISFRDINKLWIKEGSARRYDVLYRAGDEPEINETEEKEVST